MKGGSKSGRKLARAKLQGQRFGSLVVVDRAPNEPGQHSRWNCLCDCGNASIVKSCHLRSGATRSCGCGAGSAKHLHSTRSAKSPEYHSWASAKGRCFRSSNVSYKNYGGRGITMCDAWRESFETFLADMGPRPAGTSLDRIDPDGNYEPSNCRWATRDEQANNQRRHAAKEISDAAN